MSSKLNKKKAQQRRAEERARAQQKERQKKVVIGAVVLCVIAALIVLPSKLDGKSKKDDTAKDAKTEAAADAAAGKDTAGDAADASGDAADAGAEEEAAGDVEVETEEDAKADAAEDTGADTKEDAAEDTGADAKEDAAEASIPGLDTTKGRKVKEGDTVNIDYTGYKDGKAFEGGSTNGHGADLEIGSHTYIDGFESGLVGKKVGDTVDLNLTFPKDYGATDLAGKDVVFTVTINGIYE